MAISCCFIKQTLVSIPSNQVEILAIHKASCECVWSRLVIQYIQEMCDISTKKETLKIIYENNAIYITQLKECSIKDDKTKYISQSFFHS